MKQLSFLPPSFRPSPRVQAALPSSLPSTGAARETGQGIIEYTILLAFLALVVWVIVQVLEPTIGNVFSEFVSDAPVAPPSLANYTPPPTYTPSPTFDPNAPPTPTPTHTPSPTNTPSPTHTPTASNTPTASPTPPCPFPNPYTVPGRVQFENFRCGGQLVSFLDSTASGPGSFIYRNDAGPAPEGPDLAITSDTGGGYHLGWVTTGEWVEYQVTASTAQAYLMTIRYAAPNGVTPALQIDVRSGNFTGGPFFFNAPVTGGWDVWGQATVQISLFAGTNIIRVTGNTANTNANYNHFDIAVAPTPTITPTPAPTNTSVPTNTPAPTNTPTITPTPTPSGVLFVVSNPSALNASDTAVRTRLINLGNTVTLVSGANSTPGDANGKSLVVISASVNHNDVNTKFRDVPVGVILWDHALLTPMNMASSAGQVTSRTQINIISAHPLAAGLSPGLRTVTTNGQTYSWGVPNLSTALLISTVNNNNGAYTIFAYELGSTMVGGSAPARRLSFFMGDNTININANGWALFDTAVNWTKQ